MKIVVIRRTGLIGSKTVAIVSSTGEDVSKGVSRCCNWQRLT